MKLTSKKTLINKSQKTLFAFLTDLRNFEQMMPDNVEDFTIDGDSFLFSLKGMPALRLVIKEQQAYDSIVLGAASNKLDFSLTTNISAGTENSCEAQILFEGDFNPMMAMMVKKPLQQFIDALSEKAGTL